MSRLKHMRWSCVPAWLAEFCSLNGLGVEHAAVAGSVISYSLHKRKPIEPSYQSLWACLTTTRAFDGSSVDYLKVMLSDLLALGVLFEVKGGKIMPGPVAMPFEKEHIIHSFWEPLKISLAIEALINATNQGEHQARKSTDSSMDSLAAALCPDVPEVVEVPNIFTEGAGKIVEFEYHSATGKVWKGYRLPDGTEIKHDDIKRFGATREKFWEQEGMLDDNNQGDH